MTELLDLNSGQHVLDVFETIPDQAEREAFVQGLNRDVIKSALVLDNARIHAGATAVRGDEAMLAAPLADVVPLHRLQ